MLHPARQSRAVDASGDAGGEPHLLVGVRGCTPPAHIGGNRADQDRCADSRRDRTTNDQLRLALDLPQQLTPGTNWSDAHSDYVILGLILEKITREPLNVALRTIVLRPLGLRNTVASQTAVIPRPVLHAYRVSTRCS
jgi:CubicO group peptidase (beta-lactamase class C family)